MGNLTRDMTRAIQQEEIIMQTFKITILATSMVALASCANMNPKVETLADELVAARSDIINLQYQVGYIDRQLAAAQQRIADLENQ